ncbi:MAG: Lar family restriction alleviation protein [Candidatus Scalindua sp.]
MKLKPCPFCGGKAQRGIMNVWCENCGVETRLDSDASQEEIAERWNRRAK